jgi:hypothetical protein
VIPLNSDADVENFINVVEDYNCVQVHLYVEHMVDHAVVVEERFLLEANPQDGHVDRVVDGDGHGHVDKEMLRGWTCRQSYMGMDMDMVEVELEMEKERGVVDGDQGTTSKNLIQVPIGPVTRARAKKFKDVLNGLIQELWAQANSWRPIEYDPQRQQRIVTLIQVLEG